MSHSYIEGSIALNEANDSITILRSRGPKFAKTILSLDELKGYDNALWVQVEERRVNSIRELHDLLSEIEADPLRCVIRGRLRSDWEEIQSRNLPKWDEERRKGAEARAAKEGGSVQYKELVRPGPGWVLRRLDLFEDIPHHWVMLDSDEFRPTADPIIEPCEAAKEFVCRLSPEFQGASFHLQLSNSAGLPGSAGIFKAHLWFWLENKATSAQLRAWAEETWPEKSERPFDIALLQPIQIHYTSAPILAKGVALPIAQRSFYLDDSGAAKNLVALNISDSALNAEISKVPKVGMVDPRGKPGVVGAYCRAFELEQILAEHIPDIFEWVTNSRLTWLGGSGAKEGAFVRTDRQGIGASHNTWPWGVSRVANKWDLVRFFKFGHLDSSNDDLEAATLRNSRPQNLPSHIAMCEWANTLPEVSKRLAEYVGGRDALDVARRDYQKRENQKIGEGDFSIPVAEVLDLKTALERFVFLSDGSRVADILNPHFDLAFSDWSATYAASKVLQQSIGSDGINGGSEKVSSKAVPVSQLWKCSESRRTVICRTYKAGGPLSLYDPQGRWALNSWRSFDRSLAIDDLEAAGISLFLRHIEYLFGEDSNRFLDWLAHIEQRPGVLPHTAWLHIAQRFGTGRNWLASVLSRVWSGSVAASFDLVGMLKSGFNGSLSRKVLAIVDEIREGGRDSQWEHSEKLKSLITEETRAVNPKFGRQTVEFNSCRWLMFSNHLSAIPLERGDRRIEVVHLDAPPRSAGYYMTLYNALADKVFIAAVATYLAQRDISNFNPGAHAEFTDAKRSAAMASQTPNAMWSELIVQHWPCDIAPSSVLACVFACDMSTELNAGHRRALEQVGIEALGSPVKIDGKPQRLSIIRNKARWKGAEPAMLRAEWVRGRSCFGNAPDYKNYLLECEARKKEETHSGQSQIG